MENNDTQSFSWVDIIEPSLPSSSFSSLELMSFVIICVSVAMYITHRYKIIHKIAFLLQNKKIRSSQYSKVEIIKLIKLFNLERRSKNGYSEKHRAILLKSCYSNCPSNNNEIDSAIKALWKHI